MVQRNNHLACLWCAKWYCWTAACQMLPIECLLGTRGGFERFYCQTRPRPRKSSRLRCRDFETNVDNDGGDRTTWQPGPCSKQYTLEGWKC
ncbi:hypothetical protein BJY01DRAFT_202601 [Aspergillus pseudoustus]|uniref:Secreted protein n=1 Tax=Aspergillus pseudoustus TaxID=1810923 RepID=A0ABR4KYM9_9EURO